MTLACLMMVVKRVSLVGLILVMLAKQGRPFHLGAPATLTLDCLIHGVMRPLGRLMGRQSLLLIL